MLQGEDFFSFGTAKIGHFSVTYNQMHRKEYKNVIKERIFLIFASLTCQNEANKALMKVQNRSTDSISTLSLGEWG